MSWRRLLAALAIGLAACLASPATAAAMTARSANRVLVPRGTTLHDDLYAAGAVIEIRGDVDGDVIAAGSTIVIDGRVSGDVVAAGGTIDIAGPVGGSVRVCGGRVFVDDVVGADVVIAGGTVGTGPGARVGRDLAATAGDGSIEGRVGRDAWLSGGDLALAAAFGGDVRLDASHIDVKDRVRIGGDLTYRAQRRATVSDGAEIRGRARRLAPRPEPSRPLSAFVAWLRGFVGLFLFGLVTVLLFPAFSLRASNSVSGSPLASLGLGLAIAAATPIAAAAVFAFGLLLGGWWIAAMLMGLYSIALVLGYAMAALWLGRMLIGLLRKGAGVPLLLGLVAGTFVLTVLTSIPLLGWVLGAFATLAGLGAAAHTIVNRPTTPPAAAPAMAAEGRPETPQPTL